MNALATETRALSIAGIRRRLRAPVVGRQLYLCGQVESTNATLSRLARSGAPEGTVVLAEAQTAGRGRLGQPWFSPPGLAKFFLGSVASRVVAAAPCPVLTVRGK